MRQSGDHDLLFCLTRATRVQGGRKEEESQVYLSKSSNQIDFGEHPDRDNVVMMDGSGESLDIHKMRMG